MSLQLDVKVLDGLSGKGQSIIKAKFRGKFITSLLNNLLIKNIIKRNS